MKELDLHLAARIEQRRQENLFRTRLVLESPQAAEVTIMGSGYLSFCSNDYLGLANHPAVKQSAIAAIEKYGVGSGASHLVSGHSSSHHELELKLAEFTGRSKALVFSSGYMANLGVITTLAGKQDLVLEDRLNHASLIDAGLFSGARVKRYQHIDMQSLERQLSAKNKSGGISYIVSDGVFSMDGDITPLSEMSVLAEKHNAQVVIDDAHGFGCLGSSGAGVVEYFQEQGATINEHNVPVLIGTLGKAFGTSGAFVAGSETLIESLIQFCRPYIYTTAIAPALAAATLTSLELLRQDSWRRERLQGLIRKFRHHCEQLGFSILDSFTPIQSVVLGDEKTALKASDILKQAGILVTAIRPPTVPVGSSRLRVTFCAEHTDEQMQHLLDGFEQVAEKLQLDCK